MDASEPASMTTDLTAAPVTLDEPAPMKRTADEMAADTRSGGVAPIKAEFRRTVAADESADVETNAQPAKKKQRGQNKNRDLTVSIDPSKNLCHFVAQGKECYGQASGKCKFIHDVAQYAALRAPDLGDVCPLFAKHNFCKFGITCRFAKHHFDFDTMTNKNQGSEESQTSRPDVCNGISNATQALLRKRQYKFPRADAFLSTLDEYKHQKGRKHKGPREQNKGAEADGTAAGEQGEGALAKEEQQEQGKAGENEAQTESEEAGEDNPAVTGKLAEEDKTHEIGIKLRPQEKKRINWEGKTYLAPLTTVGNLPFRRICKEYGVDITCGEMAMAENLLKGQQSEWALLMRHESEDIFGVQICGAHPDQMSRVAELINTECSVDFVDINSGCPIDLVYQRGAGSGLMERTRKLQKIVQGMSTVLDCPLTVKMRVGVHKAADKWTAHTLVPKVYEWGASLVTVHGRSREQRYTKLADWDYIDSCVLKDDAGVARRPLFGNGDIFSWEDVEKRMGETKAAGVMVARGALIKPWVFQEIKEKRTIDMRSSERLDMLKRYVDYGLLHWGSDNQGVEKTRRFLLEWLSFLYRYIPAGILETLPQRMNDRPPAYVGRDDLETLMASPRAADWVKISEMLLGPVPEGYVFTPKHKANSY